ncbi:HK97 family phage prohead protease [Anatilimnocola floriformis]|uniref:HK97 family phage prohead protease n=1 Tax=Anatilimnocola floriformis TaxID=2948575 RepID=UPI0020C3177B|nr:HK97 family phage prohead protease [Anatilimnocola floriformis]
MGYDINNESAALKWLTTEETPILRSEGEKQFIEGYAVLFYDKANPGSEYHLGGNCYERVNADSFDECLLRGDNVVSWVDHNKDWQLGETKDATLFLRKDPKGIHYSIPIDPTYVDHVKAVQYQRRGKLKGSSFKAMVRSIVKRDGDKYIRTLTKATQLYELGPVFQPCYPGTSAELLLRAEVDAAERTRQQIDRWKEISQRIAK